VLRLDLALGIVGVGIDAMVCDDAVQLLEPLERVEYEKETYSTICS
jgi:hypothetical protein